MTHPDAPAFRYHIETWGCQMNVHDSEKLAGTLEREGYTAAGSSESADVVLLNTCSIREKAAEKVFDELGRLRRIKQRRPSVVIGVCGCVAQQEGERLLRRAPFVDLVLGPRAIGSLPRMLERLRQGRSSGRPQVDTEYRSDSVLFPFDAIRRVGEATGKAFVTIIEGCNHRCTYCIVPTTRGREICREMDDVLAEVRSLAARGVVEIEFLGQTVNAYRDSRGRTLGDLLVATRAIDGIRRMRFTTSHPAQMTNGLIERMAEARPVLCPYLHLPVQSGSSSVLRAMRRGYDRERYLDRIDEIRKRIPEMTFGTDVIVGFPGETEADFESTITLVETVGYDTVYSFVYSERPGTAALNLDDAVPFDVARARLQRLQSVQKSIQERRSRSWIGRELEVLVEGPDRRDPSRWTGRTPENRVVHFGGKSAAGRLERVRVSAATAFSLRGDLAGAIA